MRLWVRWSAWVSLSLMLWTVAAESTHNHPTQTESASCLICVAAHSASPTITSAYARPVFATVGVLQEKEVLAGAEDDFSYLGIRGPPSA